MKCDELQRYSLYINHEKQAFAVPDDDGTYMDSSEVDAAIAELKQKLESVQATAYADSVDAGMRERRLRRALYKACEEWFKNKACALKCFNLDARAKKFDNAVDKCRAKAEEYK